MSLPPALDHLILFLPVNPETNLPKVPSFIEENFTLTPGGVHADGITSNTLILFADGCYIELISFIDPSKAPSHWWGPDANFVGWKDWCLTNSKSPEENYESIEATHVEPIHGGRRRADGVDVKWAVTFPKGENGGQSIRGKTPFFCHDITPRNVRVPLSAENTTHPCGALGILSLTIILKDQEMLDEQRKIMTSLVGEPEDDGSTVDFRLGRVHDVEGLEGGATIHLLVPQEGEGGVEFDAAIKTGFWFGDVTLSVKATEECPSGSIGEKLDSSEPVGGIDLDWF
jgi:hypothetical protein